VVVLTLFLYYNKQYLILLGLILIFNSLALYFIGNYLLRCILFPYQNKYIKRQLNSGINRRFSIEFTRLIVVMSKIVRILSALDPLEGYYERVEEVNNSQERDNDDTQQMTTMFTTTENLNDSGYRTFDSKRAKLEINQSKYFFNIDFFFRNDLRFGLD
jgi:hypothetical protein